MYSIIYLASQRTAHRIVGYFEEEAVFSYTEYLKELESGRIDDQPAPKIAIDYWNLPLHSCLLYTSPSPRDGLLSRMPSSA